MKSGWSIVYIEGSQVIIFPKNILFLFAEKVLANIVDRNEMLHNEAFHLMIWVFTVCQSTHLEVSSGLL